MSVRRSESAALDSFTERIARRRAASSASLNPDDQPSRISSLEEDLRLSAELGQALVSENSELKDRLQSADTARDQLLDRLAASYRDNATLEKKVERLTSSLDAAEASQRTLLSALESDRKTISRLSTERARLIAAEQKARGASRERDDLKQEVDILDKRVRAAEAKAKRASERLTDAEALKATSPTSPSQRPQHVRRSSSTIILHQPSLAEQEANNMLVETLLEQNNSLRSQMTEVQKLLEQSQEETSKLREAAQQHLPIGDLSLADEFSSSSSMPNSPALATAAWSDAPPLFRRSSGSTSDSESLHVKSMHAGRRHKGGVAPIHGSRPGSFSLPKPAAGRSRPLSIDMGTLYSPAQRETVKKPLESIADASPAASRVQSKAFDGSEDGGPPSPTLLRTKLPSKSVMPTAEASVQTEAAGIEEMDDIPKTPLPDLHSPIASASSSPRRLQSSTSHKPASSVTSDSLSERHSSFNTPDTTMLSVGSTNTHDPRTAALGILLEAASKLLLRVKGANVVNLEARLKKQRLPGDVAHLARSTVKDILLEIDGLRETFRRVVEAERRSASHGSTESMVSRRDFAQLVKLFREMLSELGRLRSIVNRIQLEPSLAHKIAVLDELEAYEEPAPSSTPTSSLLAPISRLLWSQPAEEKVLKRKASSHPASKLSALNSVAPETVNVEFGSGQVKQAIRADAAAAGVIPSRSDARSGLRSIFVGAQRSGFPKGDKADGWVAISRHSGAPHDRQRGQPLSTAMDAVLDNFHSSGQTHQSRDGPHPKLLERTLRPRGLSDSSIHSTFAAHGSINPAQSQITSARLAVSQAIDDDDLAATLEDPSRLEPTGHYGLDQPGNKGPASRIMLGTSMGGGASLFGQWGASRPGLYDMMDSAPSSLRHRDQA